MTPTTLHQIAARLSAGIVRPEDADTLRRCAATWRRQEIALDEIADDALESARLAEEAARNGVVVRLPVGRFA